MSSIKVGIVEDEMLIAEGIADALQQLGYETTEPVINYTDALKMIEVERPDILLIDIQLRGKKDGIDLAARVRADFNIPFIFLTANSDAATVERAKKLNPPAYLVKPFKKDDLYTSIEICLHNFSASGQKKEPVDKDNYIIKDSIFIKQGHQFDKVRIDDITYLESENVYIYVHTIKGKFLVRGSIQGYMDLIDRPSFFRVHKSYAVNAAHIARINSESVSINGKDIPIGKTYRDELLGFLKLG